MLAGIANYIFKILALKSGILPIYKTVSRFMLYSDIVKGIKLSQIIPNFYKPKFIKQQTKFFLLYNFRYTRMFMNIKNHGFKSIVKRKLRRKFLPQEVRYMRFAYKTIKYFRPISEKALNVVRHYERMFEKKEDLFALFCCSNGFSIETLEKYAKNHQIGEVGDKNGSTNPLSTFNELLDDIKDTKPMIAPSEEAKEKLDIISSIQKLPCEDKEDSEIKSKVLNKWYMFTVKSPETNNFSQYFHLWNPLFQIYRLPIRGWNNKWTRYYWYDSIGPETIREAMNTPNFGRTIFRDLRNSWAVGKKPRSYQIPFNKKGLHFPKWAH